MLTTSRFRRAADRLARWFDIALHITSGFIVFDALVRLWVYLVYGISL